jgi:hypothetical protein
VQLEQEENEPAQNSSTRGVNVELFAGGSQDKRPLRLEDFVSGT